MDNLANFFLFFSHFTCLLPAVILGYFFVNKKTFYHSVWLICLSILFNVTLKISFKVPLAAFLKSSSFAFPSGHMQLAWVFYVWLFLRIPAPGLRIMVPPLLTGIAWALIHFGYHTLEDVVGAVISGSALLMFYAIFLSDQLKKMLPYILIVTTGMMLYIHHAFSIATHTWIAFGVLLLLMCVERLTSFSQKC